MNILITNFHPYGGGGHTTYIHSLATKLAGHGVEATVACPPTSLLYKRLREAGKVRVEGIDFPHKLKELGGIIRAVRGIRGIIKRDNIALVHCNGSPDHWIMAYYKLIYRSDVPLIRTRHSTHPVRNSWTTRFQNRLTTATVTVCQAQKDSFSRLSAFDGHDIRVISPGVDHGYFVPRPRDAEIMKKYGIGDDDMVFGSTGGTAKHKGVDAFVRAAAPVIRQDPRIKVMVMGSGISKEFQDLIDGLGISKNVFFTGFQSDVRPYYSVFDYGFVFSNAIEAISYAAREMMMMGKPVIASDIGGMPENVTDGINGYIIKGGSEQLLTETLIKVTRDRGLALKLGMKARQKADAEFREDDFLEKMAALYKSTAQKTAKAGRTS